MKITTLCSLLAFPLIQIVIGLVEVSTSQLLPEAKPAEHLRAYVGKLEIDKGKMNPNELGMLSTLETSLGSLDDYYRIYVPLGGMMKTQSSALWMLGVAQVLAIVSFYRDAKKKASEQSKIILLNQ